MFQGIIFAIVGLFLFFQGLATQIDEQMIEENKSIMKEIHPKAQKIRLLVVGSSFIIIGVYFLIEAIWF